MGSILTHNINNIEFKTCGAMIFAGCSFTWGQGLWSYYPTKWYVPKCWEYTAEGAPIPPAAEEFKEDNRYPGLVSKEFHAKQIVKKTNGGTDDESLRFIEQVRTNVVDKHNMLVTNTDWEEIHTIIIQTTDSYRSPFLFEYKNQKYEIYSSPGYQFLTSLVKVKFEDNVLIHEEQPNFDIFIDWLIDNNLTVDDFQRIHVKKMMDRIEEAFKNLEKEGKKVLLLSWTNCYLEEIKKRNYFDDKFVKLNYLDQEFDSIHDLMQKYKYFIIDYDDEVIHDSGGDAHPSLFCHQIIANSIISKIKYG
jgi:hypothetical protein